MFESALDHTGRDQSPACLVGWYSRKERWCVMRVRCVVSLGLLYFLAVVPAARAQEDDEVPELETKPLATMTAGEEDFRLVNLSRDGKTLATGSGLLEKTVDLWDATTGKAIGTLKGAKDTTQAAAFSKDGKTLVVGDYAGMLTIFDVAGRKMKKTFSVTLGIVNSTGISNDGKLAFVGQGDHAPALFNAATGKRVGGDREQQGITLVFATSDKSGTIISGNDRGLIQFLDEKTGKEKRSLQIGEHSIRALQFSSDEKTLAVGTDLALWLVDLKSGKSTALLEDNNRYNAVAFTADGKSLVAVSAPRLMMFDLETRKKIGQMKYEYRGRSDRVSLAADGSRAALAISDKEVQVLEIPAAIRK
jgi:WD40 repeat protein